MDLKHAGPGPAPEPVVALAGNPNTGKSTIFNGLTGLKQHTGNWPGKTVTQTKGRYRHRNRTINLVDLPGTYSLLAGSPEEQVARDFICFGAPSVTIVVVDAGCLERHLNLVLQVMEITPKTILCVNLIDEAEKRNIRIDYKKLQSLLGIPVVPTAAREKKGLDNLKNTVDDLVAGKIKPFPRLPVYEEPLEQALQALGKSLQRFYGGHLNPRWLALRLLDGDPALRAQLKEALRENPKAGIPGTEQEELIAAFLQEAAAYRRKLGPGLRDRVVRSLYWRAEEIVAAVVRKPPGKVADWNDRIDNIVTSRLYSYPIILLLLGFIFWLTIAGANYPSELLARLLFGLEGKLAAAGQSLGVPAWLDGLLVKGVYRSLAWVVSVMLPPMAIFFPLFTFLEDLGFLPRVAFNLDKFFKKAGAHGKQSLTMCMGFGCNAVGVTACRIIDSARERLIAILTNNFVPCNGRFPTLFIMASFFSVVLLGRKNSLLASSLVLLVILAGVGATLLCSLLLSKTILRGIPSTFTLELPGYRWPKVGTLLIRSILDRTLFVLGRAVTIAAPAGGLVWLLANIQSGDGSLLTQMAGWLQGFGNLLGMDGYIILAFILGLPANEIVLPILVMGYLSGSYLLEPESVEAFHALFLANGWTWLTALNVMLFSLLHFPCGTTLLTIRKETLSWKWTFLSVLLPTAAGITLCFLITQVARFFRLV
ncbi:MAG: ferrous iron transport protein B [Firmicutes bacterium]|nr:ferrous iron transport protein B [Bacillota bacterium]